MSSLSSELSEEKCTLAALEACYFSYRVSYQAQFFLRLFGTFPPPQNTTKLRSSLGFANSHRGYVCDFASIMAPLYRLPGKDAVYHWTLACHNAFTAIKHYLTMAFPDFSLPFWLYKDASQLGLGATLAQVQDRKECIICSASQALNHPENNYPTTKLECLSIVWAVENSDPT